MPRAPFRRCSWSRQLSDGIWFLAYVRMSLPRNLYRAHDELPLPQSNSSSATTPRSERAVFHVERSGRDPTAGDCWCSIRARARGAHAVRHPSEDDTSLGVPRGTSSTQCAELERATISRLPDPLGAKTPLALVGGWRAYAFDAGKDRARCRQSFGAFVSLSQLTVSNLRSIEHAELDVSPGLTLIWGDNGSGKTSLLEAMFLLGRGRSFRTRNNERLIQRGKDHLRVIGRVADASGQSYVLGFEATQTSTTARIAGRPAQSLAELSNAFPVQVIEPGVHRLVEEGGYRRRRWMDSASGHS
jgi:AAA domain